MNSFTLIWIVGCSLLHECVVCTGPKDDEDFSAAERTFLRYHKRFGKLKWTWSVRAFCRTMCPHKLGVLSAQVEEKEIMLEAPNCTKVRADILNCTCETRHYLDPDVSISMSWPYSFLSGLRGEIFKVFPPLFHTKCDDHQTYTLAKAIVRRGLRSIKHRPYLRGVEQIFEERTMKNFDVAKNAGRKNKRV